jgi:hypothetical protein
MSTKSREVSEVDFYVETTPPQAISERSLRVCWCMSEKDPSLRQLLGSSRADLTPLALKRQMPLRYRNKKPQAFSHLRLPGSKIDVYEICPAPVQRAKNTLGLT